MTILAAVVALLGALAAGLGAFLIAQQRRRWRSGVEARGVVVDNVHGGGSILDGQSIESAPSAPILDKGGVKITPVRRWMGYPVIEFTTASGQVVRFRSSYGSRPPAHHVGDTLVVYYDPADPQRAEIAGEGAFLSLVLIGVGVLFFAVAGVLFFAG